jgi:hypothetical protein
LIEANIENNLNTSIITVNDDSENDDDEVNIDDDNELSNLSNTNNINASNFNFKFYSESDVLKKDCIMWDLMAKFWNVPTDLVRGKIKVADSGNERCATIAAVILKCRNLGRTMNASELASFPPKHL